MAGKPENLKPFKKGNPGGPGRPPLFPTELKKLSAQEVAEVGKLLIGGDIETIALINKMARADIQRINKNPNAKGTSPYTPLQSMIASAIIKAIGTGDVNVINSLLDRFVGKIPAALLVAVQKDKESLSDAKEIIFEVVDGVAHPVVEGP